MTAESPYAAPGSTPAVPGAPLAPMPVRPTTAILPVTIAVGAVAAVAAIVNAVFGSMFPSNAPVESIYNFGVTVDLVAVVAVMLVRALVVFRRPRGDANRRPSVFAILGASFAVLILAGWLLFGGLEYWADGMARYMSGSSGAFYLGTVWVLAIVFGEIGLRRRDSTLNTALAVGALVVGAIVTVATVAAAVIYGLGLSA